MSGTSCRAVVASKRSSVRSSVFGTGLQRGEGTMTRTSLWNKDNFFVGRVYRKLVEPRGTGSTQKPGLRARRAGFFWGR